ncbi:MAG: cupredoxin domain-containing protein [bacterium]|nr:cupredoxin domain-containing protein [bacterium]
MNNKILIIIIGLVAIIGGLFVLGNKKMNPTAPIQSEIQSQTTTAPVVTIEQNQTTTVTLADAGFTPKDITIKAGTTVIWTNKSGKNATVSSDDHPTHKLYPFLNLGPFADGATLQVAIEKAGIYSYHNHLNASETGTITAE